MFKKTKCDKLSVTDSTEFKLYTAWGFLMLGLAFSLLFVNECTNHLEARSLKWAVTGSTIGWFVIVFIHSVTYDSYHRCCNKTQLTIRTILMFALYSAMCSVPLFWVYYTYSRDILIILTAFASMFVVFAFYAGVFWEARFACGGNHQNDFGESQAVVFLISDILFLAVSFTLLIVAGVYDTQLDSRPAVCIP